MIITQLTFKSTLLSWTVKLKLKIKNNKLQCAFKNLMAVSAGIEPAKRFFNVYGLAIRCNTIIRTHLVVNGRNRETRTLKSF